MSLQETQCAHSKDKMQAFFVFQWDRVVFRPPRTVSGVQHSRGFWSIRFSLSRSGDSRPAWTTAPPTPWRAWTAAARSGSCPPLPDTAPSVDSSPRPHVVWTASGTAADHPRHGQRPGSKAAQHPKQPGPPTPQHQGRRQGPGAASSRARGRSPGVRGAACPTPWSRPRRRAGRRGDCPEGAMVGPLGGLFPPEVAHDFACKV